MCGIAGFFNPMADDSFCSDTIFKMLDLLKARGPDGTAWIEIEKNNQVFWKKSTGFDNNLRPVIGSIGCSRLAIVDRSDAGLQPLSNETEDIWAVLNGEIYNFIELRVELEQKGHKFKTATDTEVICHAYEEWGQECFKHFNGHFGICIFDLKNKNFFIARDRLGMKPIYWYKDDNFFLFASEIKSILSLPLVKRKINTNKLSSVIGLPYKLHENWKDTLFENIIQVEPGYLIKVDSRLTISKQAYWKPDKSETHTHLSLEESTEYLTELLKSAVEIRLRGDCDPTFLLSGGIDSSSVAGISKKVFNKNFETFSLNLPDDRFNENDEINEISNYLDISSNYIDVNPRIIKDLLPTLIEIFDETIPTPNGILHYLLAKEISKKGYKVVLNGVGGDEVFLGYHDHFLFYLDYIKTNQPDCFSKELGSWSEKQNRSKTLYGEFSEYLSTGAYFNSPDFLSKSGNAKYLGCLRKEYQPHCYMTKEFFGDRPYDVFTKQVLDLTKFTLPHAIKMDDRFYMSQGIETRHPFLDFRIVEFGLNLPPHYKMRDGVSKTILRSAVNGFIPKTRQKDLRKIGLNLPIDKWMQKELRMWIDENLLDQQNPIYEFADFKEIKRIASNHISGKENHYLKLWDLINVSLWLKTYFM